MRTESELTLSVPKENHEHPFLMQDDAAPRNRPSLDEDYLNLRRTAARLDHSYFWLSRNYRRLGLRPSRIGGKLLFERREVDLLLKRQKVGVSGRPRISRF